ncbi:hypothetical protein K0M31_004744 [Melipona bicolor]|uniref:Uncharacterized protein n=1 Tax=Melipona bicolor TaxID=60889 RepID=A0AA40FVQ4_9HYME|nr:hypothetical protein K0M31_004744 [Melipona bicolor]
MVNVRCTDQFLIAFALYSEIELEQLLLKVKKNYCQTKTPLKCKKDSKDSEATTKLAGNLSKRKDAEFLHLRQTIIDVLNA